ncbi:MAG: DUF790 family protein [Victivallaceae bacterium]|nr:DUF790 family protein [Victivallaceae bacterium]
MFTLEHLRFRRVSGYLKPHFVNPGDRGLLAEAEASILVCQLSAARGSTRSEVAEQLSGGDRVAAALGFLLMKRLEFTPPSAVDYPEMRAELFERSAARLQAGGTLSREDYRAGLRLPEQDIYGDLPDDERCVGFNQLSPAALLYHYNLNQVQTLLAFAEKLEFTMPDPPKAKLRNLFKQLRFNRLVAEISGGKAEDCGIVILTVSGPLSLFSETRKYAMALGNFFPGVLALDAWKLRAEIAPPRGEPAILLLDQSAPLSSVGRRHWSIYEPEEFSMFRQLFREKCAEFEIVEDPEFMQLGPGEAVFPDFTFRDRDGGLYTLELFHRHHAGELGRRLKWLASGGIKSKYLAGIDRSLLTRCPEADKMCAENHPNIFAFRDFPGVTRVLSLLKKLSAIPDL